MIIIMIIMVMILYFFASYSLYVALCFSVVNKSKAPSHLSAPRSPAVADLAQLPAAPSLRRQTLVRGAGGRCFLRI